MDITPKITEAPWLMNCTNKYVESEAGLAITNANGVLVAYVSHDLSDKTLEEYLANANVITAAPLLLDALMVIPPDKLRALAKFLDQYDKKLGIAGDDANMVQEYLRKMAGISELAIKRAFDI